ncbi:hypothetical protein N7486_005923 [Penicillium sp. IBT 16267x]|nr:hypothetical protein N7486_005923 [Penicillium sp. IBT 16267x]
MATCSQPAGPNESEKWNESDASSNVSAIFSDNGSESESNSDLEPDSEDSDDDDDLGNGSFDDEGQLPPEHYLAQAQNLDVSHLRQKRWRCDVRRGKNGRHSPGIRTKSSLETFWKNWHLILKQEAMRGLSEDTMVKVNDIVALVAKEKDLDLRQRPKKNMYIEDVAEFARVLLTTTEMTLECGWERIQVLLFCQLAAITRFLGKKAPNEFKIPEIIVDPTLVLSPHICLLGMLFHIKGFKAMSKTGPVLDFPENLYRLGVLEGKGQQELLLKDRILDKFVFCQAVRETTGYRIALETQRTASMVRSRMRLGGQITGFEQVAKPYLLRYAGAKALNDSEEVTNELQMLILQHSDIRTFVRHYQVDVDVDVQGIIRKTGSQTPLVRFACSLSASIDPNRPWKLSTEESRSLNELPEVRARQGTVDKRKRRWEDRKTDCDRAGRAYQTAFGHLEEGAHSEVQRQKWQKLEILQDNALEAKRKYNKAVRELKNEKQRQRNRRIWQKLERYKNEQPVIDLEQQLAGKLVNPKVMGALEHRGFMPPEHLTVIDTLLTKPGATIEAEYQRRINAINAVTAFCGVEEGRPTPRPTQSRRRPAADDDPSCPPAKQSRLMEDSVDAVLRQAMESVRIKFREERPTICFLCIGNPNLSLEHRVRKYATPGSLTRHFLQKHVKPDWPAEGVECNICGREPLQQKANLINHAETAHGTVVRGRDQERFALDLGSCPHVVS